MQPYDVIDYAGQIGRLDLVSALLTAVSIVLAVGGLLAFFEIRTAAKRKAKVTAQETTLEYLQTNLPTIVVEIIRDFEPQIKALLNTNEYSADYGSAQEEPQKPKSKKGGK